MENKIEINNASIIQNNKVIATKSEAENPETFAAPMHNRPAEVLNSQDDVAEFSVATKWIWHKVDKCRHKDIAAASIGNKRVTAAR